jgi:hypothetical protein
MKRTLTQPSVLPSRFVRYALNRDQLCRFYTRLRFHRQTRNALLKVVQAGQKA